MNDHLLGLLPRQARLGSAVLTRLLLLAGAMAACGNDALPEDVTPGAGGAGAAGGGSAASGAGVPSSSAGAGVASGGAAPTSGAGGAAGSAEPFGGTGANAAGGVAGAAGDTGAGAAGRAGAGGTGPEPKRPLKVWMAGDSTMQECSSACPCGWGSRFDKLFDADVTVVNRAVGGRSIQTWLYEGAVSTTKDASGECMLTSTDYATRWKEMLDATSGMQKGDYLFVQFGINDSTDACPRHVGQAKFKSYLASMAKAASDRGATPVLVTPVSAIACSGSSAVGTRGGFVDYTKEVAMAAPTPLVDLHQLSVDRYTALGFCPNNANYGTGKVGDFFCQDHTHFESAGAEEIAKIVAKALMQAQLPLADYLLPGSDG